MPVCEWCNDVDSMPVKYEGNRKNPLIMFIGRNPGRDEVEQKRPFVGGAGKILRETITSVTQRDPSDFRIVNLVKCYVDDNKCPPRHCMIMCYSNYLHDEIGNTNPRSLVLRGNEVASFFLHRKVEATKEHGTIVELYERPALITVHPGWVKRGNPNYIEDDLRKLWNELDVEVI